MIRTCLTNSYRFSPKVSLFQVSCSLKTPYTKAIKRSYSSVKEVKRFYKNVSISQANNGGYEVNLDQRKLKTPLGKLFVVPNEALALAVETEWDAQEDVIRRHTMHLTHLCNTAIDRPTQRDKATVAGGILEYLNTDTICYRTDEPPELAERQEQEWSPFIDWMEDRYNINVPVTCGLSTSELPENTRNVLHQHLLSQSDWAIIGYQQVVELLKSAVLGFALLDRHIGVETAVSLARLELQFQIERWGNVEWAHDVDLMDLQTKVAAATLFVHLCSESSKTLHKGG
ncbi:ATP synthase mitochondrial F1 complex assembly factor 2-like [Lineus longissimus]|uniref:ATP synthase mitochondrial F1 complex assembly factor 2-like n=1 Tax=Lineus longissimus TaxID=88925 RepID=UPI00315D14BE